MKEFNLQNYNHPNEVLKELASKLTELNIDELDVISTNFGSGYVDSCSYKDGAVIITVCFDQEVEMHDYNLLLALNSKTISFTNEKVLDLLKTYLDGLAKVRNEFNEHLRIQMEEADRLAEIERAKHARLVELARERKAREEAEEKARKKTEAMIYKLDLIKANARYVKNSADVLEYLKNNLTSITAIMPDTLEDWFIKTFGDNAEHKTVSHLKKTSGGYKMQFSLSIKGHLKDTTGLPAELAESVKGKELRNTALLFKLVLDDGFKFGKQA